MLITNAGTPLVNRGANRQSAVEFAFRGANGAGEANFVVPYTREQYLALPRKKKKSVLTSVKALLRYSATSRLIEALESRGSQNPRIVERIERLKLRLAQEKKNLPTAALWVEAVKRVTK